MLSHTLSQGKLASSWNTTPTPAGTSSPTGLPSKLTVPSVGAVRPASVSSSVVLPQPDGPTMVTNSPAARSRSSGPSAWTRPLPDSKTLLTPLSRARTCAMPAADSSMGPGLQILRQEPHVGDFLPVDRLLELADDLQAFDHTIHRGVIQRAFAPVFDVEKMPEYLARERRVDVVGLGDDIGRLGGMRLDVFHAFAAALDDRPDLLGPGLVKLVGDDADGLRHVGRQHVLGPEHRLDLGSFLRPHRLAGHAGVDGAAQNRGEIGADAAGRNQRHFPGVDALGLHRHQDEHVGDGARRGVADLLADDVLDGVQRRIRLGDPENVGDALGARAYDFQPLARPERLDRGRAGALPIGQIPRTRI